ncbi:MAG: VWA domain-containing protein [Pirellulaceae bacterium]
MTLWWGLALLAIVLIGWYAFQRGGSVPTGRRWVLSILLALGVLGPLLIALNPTLVEEVPPIPGRPMLTVLIDGTMSMRTEDADEQRSLSRWRRAVELANQVKPDHVSVEVRKMAFGELVKPFAETADAEGNEPTRVKNSQQSSLDSVSEQWPQGHHSNLAMAIRQVTRTGSPVGHAVMLVSDGAHNVGSSDSVLQAAKEANALATPIYTVTLGTSLGMQNMSVVARSPRLIAFPDRPVSLRASIGHNGLIGQSTQVSLMKENEVIQRKSVRLTSDATQEVRFDLADGIKEPIERFRIVASDVPGEVTTADNQTTILVQRLSAPIGVLVLEGKPYWDTKFLARNLARDPVVDLTTIIRLGTDRFLNRKVNADPTNESGARSSDDVGTGRNSTFTDTKTSDWSVLKDFSSPLDTLPELEKYRLIILGRDAEAFLTDASITNLRNWISQGGGCLLCTRGAPTDKVAHKLAEILPVRWTPAGESRFRATISQHGIDTSVFDPLLAEGIDPFGSLPSLAVGATPQTRVGLPQVLMESSVDSTDGRIPIVTYQPFGTGQTVVVEGAGMWRWAFLPPQHAAKDKIYPTLWQSMIQWIISQQNMMPGQEVAVQPDRASFLTGDRATATVTVRDTVKWSNANGDDSISVLLQSSEMDLPKRVSLAPSGLEQGLFRADLGALDVGYYTLKAVTGVKDQVLAATAFDVRDPWFESLEVDARPDLMRQVAKLSGGQVLSLNEVRGLVERFDRQLRSQQRREETRTAIWDQPWVLIMILLCWISTWIVRRKVGLV